MGILITMLYQKIICQSMQILQWKIYIFLQEKVNSVLIIYYLNKLWRRPSARRPKNFLAAPKIM